MTIETWLIIGLLILFIVLTSILMFIVFNEIGNEALYKKVKKKYQNAIEGAFKSYYNSEDYEQCVFELDLAFENIVMKNERLQKEINNIPISIEKYILSINTDGIGIKVSDVDLYKRALREFLQKYKSNNPMAQIQGADFVVLKEIMQCIEESDTDKGNEIVNQLATEIKNLQDQNLEYVKNGKKQDVLTKIGLALTVVFGVMTFVQFFI